MRTISGDISHFQMIHEPIGNLESFIKKFLRDAFAMRVSTPGLLVVSCAPCEIRDEDEHREAEVGGRQKVEKYER